MKKITLFFLLVIALNAQSQKNESFYVFDSNWKPTKIESAHFFLHTQQVNDSCWQWDFYNFMGPLVKTVRYRDKKGEELDGISYYYDQKGNLDSATNFQRGKRNGDSWKYNGDSLKATMKYIYLDDSLVEAIDLTLSRERFNGFL